MAGCGQTAGATDDLSEPGSFALTAQPTGFWSAFFAATDNSSQSLWASGSKAWMPTSGSSGSWRLCFLGPHSGVDGHQHVPRARESGVVGPGALRVADHGEMIDVMARGGYSRYDGIATRKLQGAGAKLLDEYEDNLNDLHEKAMDGADLLVRLKEFWGVGDTTAGTFLRELRGLWPKADPPSVS